MKNYILGLRESTAYPSNAISEEKSILIDYMTNKGDGRVSICFSDGINVNNIHLVMNDQFVWELTEFIKRLQLDYYLLYVDRSIIHTAILSDNGIDALKGYMRNIAENIFIPENVNSALDDMPEVYDYNSCMSKPLGDLLENRDELISEYSLEYDINKRLRAAYNNHEFTEDQKDQYLILLLSG